MSADIVPIIYSLRSRLNGNCSHGEQVDAIADAMLKLERIYSDFDSLEIVKKLKEMLADQLLHDSLDVNIRNHLQMRGFEPIRRAIISTQIPASSCDLNLLAFQYAPTSNKKQKSGGYSMSFNFDDFPMFETVDSMLAGLRNDLTDRESLNKILALDLNELLDHPQWEELLQTLHKSVSVLGDHTTIVMAIFHRFVNGFKGSSQGLDAMNTVLVYLAEAWISTSTTHAIGSTNAVTSKNRLALFCTVLQTSAMAVQVPYQKEADRAVALLFLLLSKGTVPIFNNDTTGQGIATIMDALAETKEQGASILALLRAIHPFTAFSYAVQTGLLSTLFKAVPIHQYTCNSSAAYYRTSCIRLRVLLSLLSGFGDNAANALRFVEDHLRKENDATVLNAVAYEWHGQVSDFIASNRDTLMHHKGTTDQIGPIEHSNKRFLHLSQAESLMPWFQRDFNSVEHNLHKFMVWLSDTLATLTALLRCALSTSIISRRDTAPLADIVNLSLQVMSSVWPGDRDHTHSVVSSCSEIVDLLAKHGDGNCVEDVLVGYIAGLTTLLERGTLPPAGCIDNLLQGAILSPNGEMKYAIDTQCAYVRLLSTYVMRPNVDNPELVITVAQLCIDKLSLVGASDHVISCELQSLLLQLLQTLCGNHARCVALRAHKLLLPSAALLLSFLVNPDYADQHTADANRCTAHALLSAFSLCNESEVMECLLEDDLLRVMEEEYLDADTWDRALDCEHEHSRAFSGVFTVLLGLASLGQVKVLNAVLGESWGACIAAGGTNELADLPVFTANLCLRSEGALSVVCENVFPYIARLLSALQHDLLYLSSVSRLYEERKNSAEEHVPDAEGIDLVDVFIVSTIRAMENMVIFECSRASNSHAFFPATESELQAFHHENKSHPKVTNPPTTAFVVPVQCSLVVDLLPWAADEVWLSELQGLMRNHVMIQLNSNAGLPASSEGALEVCSQVSMFLQMYLSSTEAAGHHEWLLAAGVDAVVVRVMDFLISQDVSTCTSFPSTPVFVAPAWVLLCDSAATLEATPVSQLCAACSESVLIGALSLLEKFGQGSVVNELASAGVPINWVLRIILQQWFFSVLPVEDVLVITAATVLRDTRFASLVAAAIVLQYQHHLRTSTPQAFVHGGPERVNNVLFSSGKLSLRALLPDVERLAAL